MSQTQEKIKAAKRKTQNAIEVLSSKTNEIAQLTKMNYQLESSLKATTAQLKKAHEDHQAEIAHAQSMVKKVAIAHIEATKNLFFRCRNHFTFWGRVQRQIFNSKYENYKRLQDLHEAAQEGRDSLSDEAGRELDDTIKVMATRFLQDVINEDMLVEDAKQNVAIKQEEVPVGRIAHGREALTQ